MEIKMTEREIEFCVKAIHAQWDNYGIPQDEIRLLIKLENYIEIPETKNYLEAIGFPLMEGEENGEEESWSEESPTTEGTV